MVKILDGIITIHCSECKKDTYYPLYAIKDDDEEKGDNAISNITIDFAACIILWDCPSCKKLNKMHFSPVATHGKTGARFPRIKTM